MSLEYVGSELELFAHATNWKAYVSRYLSPYITGRVLEVGAGIGSNIQQFGNPHVRDWLALEPGATLAAEIDKRLKQTIPPFNCRVVSGTIDDVQDHDGFDAILYIDVLEHIADDQAELVKAAGRLALGGCLIVLSPAHQFLYSPFDKSIGHFRRYNARGLKAITPPGCRMARLSMLDSVGFFASLANRLLLRSAMPTLAQITAWDRAMVPLSRVIDPLTGFRFGKTVIAVWKADTVIRNHNGS